MSEKFSNETPLDAAADSTNKVLDAAGDRRPESDVFPLFCAWTDASGKLVGSNFYWLSTQTGDARLGEIQLVHDSDCFLRRLHRARRNCPR